MYFKILTMMYRCSIEDIGDNILAPSSPPMPPILVQAPDPSSVSAVARWLYCVKFGDDIMPSLYQLESVHSDVIYLELCGIQLPIRATELIAEALSTIEDYCEITRRTIEVANRSTTCPGRPRFDLSRRQLDHLMELGFTAVDMASILGVSRSTIHRRFQEFGMSMGRKYCIISNEHLDDIVRSITHLYPDCGQKNDARPPKGTRYCCTANKAKRINATS